MPDVAGCTAFDGLIWFLLKGGLVSGNLGEQSN
jgi:hypothetical protein